jgi:hypothetical protein
MSKRSKGPEMPTRVRAFRQAMKAEDIPLTLTPAERIFTAQSFPQQINGRHELVLYDRLRKLLTITPVEILMWGVPTGGNVNLYDYDDRTAEIMFSLDGLELLGAHFLVLEQQKALPNQTAILTMWEKIENELDGLNEDEADEVVEPATTNGEQKIPVEA